MSIRFRIRTPAGQELSFASRAMFEDFVRSGDLSPDDLVYDAEDGSWAPARTHPIVLDIEYEEEEAAPVAEASEPDPPPPAVEEPDPASPGAAGSASADPTEALDLVEEGAYADPTTDGERHADPFGDHPEEPAGDLGLDLAISETPTPEEASRAFVERLEAERRADIDFGRQGEVSGFSMDHSGTIADLASGSDESEPAPPPRRPEPPRRPAPSRDRVGARRAEPSPPRAAPRKSGGAGRLMAAAFVVALAAGGAYVAFGQGGAETPGDPPPETPVTPIEVEPTPEPPRQPVIARTVAAVRDRALERFLGSTQAALRGLQPVPGYWPSGEYLALPSAHPEIVSVWQSYRSTVRSVRAADGERYRVAYEAALDDAVIEGDERAQRLADGLAAFRGSAAARAAHYDRVEALATAALQSHNALVQAEGLLLYDGPPGGTPGAPVGAGVTARDEESQLLLDNVVQLLTSVLEAGGAGPGSGDNVRAWVWDGFLDAVTN